MHEPQWVELTKYDFPQDFLSGIQNNIDPAKIDLILIFANGLDLKQPQIEDFLFDNQMPCVFVGFPQLALE